MDKDNHQFNYVKALPVWDGELSQYSQHFMTGMQFHGPFIATKMQARNDLGNCVISTFPPHIVCKIHAFKTGMKQSFGEKTPNENKIAIAEKAEDERRQYLEQRSKAFENEIEATRLNISVRELMEKKGIVYDEEFDEPRLVVKIPGINAYLELIGCLDAIDYEDLDWTGEHGVLDTLSKMSEWAQNVWDSGERRALASSSSDLQPVPEWEESYNPEFRPMMPRKRGLGHTYADPSRRPEMLYSKAPQGSKDVKMILELKKAQADIAAKGIAPENYGKK